MQTRGEQNNRPGTDTLTSRCRLFQLRRLTLKPNRADAKSTRIRKETIEFAEWQIEGIRAQLKLVKCLLTSHGESVPAMRWSNPHAPKARSSRPSSVRLRDFSLPGGPDPTVSPTGRRDQISPVDAGVPHFAPINFRRRLVYGKRPADAGTGWGKRREKDHDVRATCLESRVLPIGIGGILMPVPQSRRWFAKICPEPSSRSRPNL